MNSPLSSIIIGKHIPTRYPQVYRYGASIGFYGLSYMMTMVVTSEIFLPVFYRLAITSTYEVSVLWFLDQRLLSLNFEICEIFDLTCKTHRS